MLKATIIGVILLVVLAAGWVWLQPRQQEYQATIDVGGALGQQSYDGTGFRRVLEPRQFNFPADHGPHPEYKTEWWYYTGNLQSDDGRQWGYQLTFFRNGLPSESRASNWQTSDIYMAHFAVTDAQEGNFFSYEKFSRNSIQLAGARSEPYRVWVTSWEAKSEGDGTRLRATAPDGKAEINLLLQPTKPLVLQGDQGLSQKSSALGNASYYYSVTRLATKGTIIVNGTAHQVRGWSWLDREWSTSSLGAGQVGWDWFALQFEDGRELMYYQLRLADGGVEPLSSGTLIGPDGSTTRINRDDIQIEVLDRWVSPHTQATYPSRWRLVIPKVQLDIEITPLLADQELLVSVAYWEGAVRVQGTDAGRPVAGTGYVELTGYVDQPPGQETRP
jgi:predicted secreted hydrolase